MTVDGDYLTAEQIAAELGVHPATVRRYFREGEDRIPGRRFGKSWMTTRAAFDAWLLRQRRHPDGHLQRRTTD
jgi:excisionase family DNA binding protein